VLTSAEHHFGQSGASCCPGNNKWDVPCLKGGIAQREPAHCAPSKGCRMFARSKDHGGNLTMFHGIRTRPFQMLQDQPSSVRSLIFFPFEGMDESTCGSKVKN